MCVCVCVCVCVCHKKLITHKHRRIIEKKFFPECDMVIRCSLEKEFGLQVLLKELKCSATFTGIFLRGFDVIWLIVILI